MRGFFGIGVEGISKEANLGNLIRSAHSFGASHFFTIAPALNTDEFRVSDTSDAFDHLPYYEFENLQAFKPPAGAQIVGIELTRDAISLPSFRHPTRAIYVLGPEMGSLSEDMQAKCDFTIKIPMKFCVNVGVAGALVMYDRLLSMGQFVERPVKPGGPTDDLFQPPKVHRRRIRSKM